MSVLFLFLAKGGSPVLLICAFLDILAGGPLGDPLTIKVFSWQANHW